MAGKLGTVRCKDSASGQTVREFVLGADDGIDQDRYFLDGKLTSESIRTGSGPYDRMERVWAADGKLVQETNKVKDRPRGLQRAWYRDGKPWKVEWVAKVYSEGAAVEYLPSGQLAAVRCGLKPVLAPHVNDASLCGFEGGPSTLQLYAHGGAGAGVLLRTVVLAAGVEQQATTYFANGKPQLQEELQQGGTLKRETRYAAEGGGKQAEKLWYLSPGRAPLLLRESSFNASGVLVAERQYRIEESHGNKFSRLTSESRFYPNGQLRRKDVYLPAADKVVMRDTLYYTDRGTLKQHGRYALDSRHSEHPVGVHQSFFADGKTEWEESFDAHGRMTRQKVWDASGKLVSDEAGSKDG